MSSGTSNDYWKDKALPSVFKHTLLEKYLYPFSAMTATQTADKRVVYLDGYAGEGRYEDGDPASGEIVLQVALKLRSSVTLECYFAEAQRKSFTRLEEVVHQYQQRGVRARAYCGEVDGVLDGVVENAVQRPLFLFLDPCGLVLPQDRLVEVLASKRPGARPATELLMNFSMMAVWRLGGHVRSPRGNERSLQRFDEVCGGDWWREYFAEGRARFDTAGVAEDAIEAVASGYARRIEQRTGMKVHSVPVSHSPRRRAVYQLVFATRRSHGLWVFGDSVARARDAWWSKLDNQDGQLSLFPQAPDPAEVEGRAIPEIAANLEKALLKTNRPIKLVDHPLEVLGSFYGQVTDKVVRKAVKLLHSQGKTPSDGVGEKHVRNIVVAPQRR